MKTRTLISIFLMLCVFASDQESQAQIKVHDNGHISLQSYTADWQQGVQIFPSGVTHFNTNKTTPWHWVTIASPKHPDGKCWIVTYPDGETNPEDQKEDQRFYVTGRGFSYQRRSLILQDANLQTEHERLSNPGAILDGITGNYYIPVDETDGDAKESSRRVGVMAHEVEKYLPEAVSRDDNDLMYVDYEALTVVLIEAYKEQKAEIELLRKTLEEHGLLKPEK